jgi:hypothetical protein
VLIGPDSNTDLYGADPAFQAALFFNQLAVGSLDLAVTMGAEGVGLDPICFSRGRGAAGTANAARELAQSESLRREVGALGGEVTRRAPKLWNITREMTDATKNIKGRMYYRHKSTGLWWSRDTAEHGGSAWKVFTEEKGGTLHWYHDADEFGNFIDRAAKHKGPIGKVLR